MKNDHCFSIYILQYEKMWGYLSLKAGATSYQTNCSILNVRFLYVIVLEFEIEMVSYFFHKLCEKEFAAEWYKLCFRING